MTAIIPVIPEQLKMFFSAKRNWHRGGKKDTWNKNKRNKVPIFKEKCHSCLEKDMHYAPDCPKPKKNTERANQKGKNG